MGNVEPKVKCPFCSYARTAFFALTAEGWAVLYRDMADHLGKKHKPAEHPCVDENHIFYGDRIVEVR